MVPVLTEGSSEEGLSVLLRVIGWSICHYEGEDGVQICMMVRRRGGS